MKKIFLGVLVLLLLAVPAINVFAQRKLTIKLASLAPENTDWGAALNRMAADWARISNNEVELVVYHNGIQGGENAVLQKLKGNAIQAGVFTSIGMSLISPEVITMSAPFFIRNDAELDMVLAEVKPELEKRINDRGFFMLTWAKSGWLKIFSKNPVSTPSELKSMSVGGTPDIPKLTQAFRTMGYKIIETNLNDLLIAVNTGKVDAIYQSPIYVASMQVFTKLKYMASINIAPFMGGLVLNRQAYRELSRRSYWKQLQEVALRTGRDIDASIGRLESAAVNTMLRYGLVDETFSSEQERVWYAEFEESMPALVRNGTFDQALYDRISAILRRYRSR
ncbi:MAG: TRAP transporter substrate-binding protein DctP [Treponema sp.]|jgi:TRAP-type C4-dicarboxylate transport system substrate-binding protein|nr:TRAP transporter substrate-binding protein DctP [Treponema sp.]